MATKVWKYGITAPDEAGIAKVTMPQGAEILSLYGGNFVALVDPDAPTTEFKFKVVRTDEAFDAAGTKYLGSYMMEFKVPGDPKKKDYKMFHVFRVVEEVGQVL